MDTARKFAQIFGGLRESFNRRVERRDGRHRGTTHGITRSARLRSAYRANQVA